MEKCLLKCLAALALILSAIGCGADAQNEIYEESMRKIEARQPEDAKEDPAGAVIKYWSLFPLETDGSMKRLVSEFKGIHPNIEFESASVAYNGSLQYGDVFSADFYERQISNLELLILSGDAPDVIQEPRLLKYGKYVKNGYFADFKELMDDDASFSADGYYSNILSAKETGGKLYAFPASIEPCYAMINKAAADSAGIDVAGARQATIYQLLDWYGAFRASNPDIPAVQAAYYNALAKDSEKYKNWRFSELLENQKLSYNYESGIYFSSSNSRSLLLMNFGLYDFMLEGSLPALRIARLMKELKDIEEPLQFGGYTATGVAFPDEFCLIDFMTSSQSAVKFNRYEMSSDVIPLVDEDGRRLFSTSDYAIASSSKAITISWEFIKFLVEDKQLNDYKINESPINSEFWGVWADYLGFPINRSNCEAIVSYYTHSSQKFGYIEEWISSLEQFIWADDSMPKTISEIASRYYDDLIGIEQAIEEMSERIDMYLNE
ncbi:MAG: extracellular solute-binding protein [Clostridiales bacterium]|nr:extracellular solute-binding protein [Clostridiales bacterium]